MILMVNPVGDFPLNDDWVYGSAVQSMLSGDGFRLPAATIANAVAQAAWGEAFCIPFGFSYTALRVSTLTLGLIGLWFFQALLRENARLAFVATASLAVYPLFLDLANGFMTDVPFTAMMLVALYCLTRFLRDDAWWGLLAGVLVSFAAILTRQIAFAILLAFAVANTLKYRFRIGPALLGVLPLLLGIAIHLGWQTWLTATGRGPEVPYVGISPFIPRDIARLVSYSIHTTIYVTPYIGFALVPVVVVIGPPARRLIFGLICLAVLIVLWWKGDLIPVAGNVILESGIGPLTQRDTYLLGQNLPPVTAWTRGFWLIITGLGVIGIVSFVIIVGQSIARRMLRLWRGNPDGNDWLWIMAAITGMAYWAAILLLIYQNGYYFDRYIIPLVPLALILLIASEPGPVREPVPASRIVIAGVLLVLTGALSVTGTADYLAWNRARWTALHHLTVELGIPPARIDGGYEFNGSMLWEPGFHSPPGKSYWWVRRDDYMLASGPLPGYRELTHYDVARFLPFGVARVVVLRRSELKE